MLTDSLLFLGVGLVVGLLCGWLTAPGRCPEDDQRGRR
jgi:hypothetical protein